jgi:Ca-activated chloride channel family protein
MIGRLCTWDFPAYARIHPLFGCLRVALLLISSMLVLAQTTDQEVHITPRIKPVTDPTKESDSFLKTPTKLFRVKVDLVLVPVTVTDPINRLVTGLGKEHFQVYENKEKQFILHFSSAGVPGRNL